MEDTHMSKYDPLGSYLKAKGTEFVPMTFADIERVIGTSLPESKCYPAWWSNNETNNVMTKVWRAAGYRTERVDIQGKKLVFRRIAPPASADGDNSAAGQPAIPSENGDSHEPKQHPLFNWLKDNITIAPGTDLTEPAYPNWGE